MSSFLDKFVDLRQLQRESAAPSAALQPLTQPMHQDPPAESENDSRPGSGDEDEEQDTQHPPNTQDNSDTVAAFTVNTARNLRLTTDGERSLLQFSQVVFFSRDIFLHHTHVVQTMYQARYEISLDLPASNAY